jgi:hypothetical protein
VLDIAADVQMVLDIAAESAPVPLGMIWPIDQLAATVQQFQKNPA